MQNKTKAPTLTGKEEQGQETRFEEISEQNHYSNIELDTQAEFAVMEITSNFPDMQKQESTPCDFATSATFEVIPLRKKPQEEIPYPVEAFGIFAEALKAFADGVQVKYSMAGNSLLTALATCFQSMANVVTKDGRIIPLVLFLLSIAESGDRKSALDKIVFYVIQQIEKERYKEYQKAFTVFDIAKKKWEKLPKKEKDSSSFEDKEPTLSIVLIENANIERIIRILSEGSTSLALVTSEGGILFGGNAFLKENVIKTITTFSKFCDGDSVDKMRGSERTIKLYDRRLSMHIMLQPQLADNVLSNEEMQNQGFLPRFLISGSKSLQGTRLYTGKDVRTDPRVQKFYQVCREAFTRPQKIDQDTGGLIFDKLYLSDKAHELWVMHYNDIETKLMPDNELKLVSAYASKNAEQALRIAGIFALAENPQATHIEAETMKNAIILARWYLAEALRLRQNSITPKNILLAEKLLQFLKRKECKQFNARYVMRNSPLREKKSIDEAIKTLLEHKYIIKGGGETVIDEQLTKNFYEVLAWE